MVRTVGRVTRVNMLITWWVLVASYGATPPARADRGGRPLADALELRPGASCLSREALSSQIAAWLGKDTIDHDLSLLVAVHAHDARDVSFELRRGELLLASRRFAPAPAGCAQLEAILALAIAMAVEVSLRDELLVSLGGGPAPARLQTSVATLAELGLRLLPGTSTGGAVRVGLRVHRLVALRFEGWVHTSQNEALRGAPVQLELDTWLAGVRAAACLLLPLTRALVVSTCGGLGAGSLRIAGEGNPGARAARLPWAALAAAAELSVALSEHWSLEAGASLEVPLGQRRYGLRHADGTVATSEPLPRVAATLRAGPAYYF
jgi:hypothetical protein